MPCSACSVTILNIFLRETLGLRAQPFALSAARSPVHPRRPHNSIHRQPWLRSNLHQSSRTLSSASASRQAEELSDADGVLGSASSSSHTTSALTDKKEASISQRINETELGNNALTSPEMAQKHTPEREEHFEPAKERPAESRSENPPNSSDNQMSLAESLLMEAIRLTEARKLEEAKEQAKLGLGDPLDTEVEDGGVRLPTHRRLEPWQIQKNALKNKLGGQAWAPRKRLSPDAMDGIRALHAQYPDKYTTPYLAEQFKVSAEAIRRILKSNWRPNEEEHAKRLQRWERRGKSIWGNMVELGVKPPKKWREMGVDRDSEGRSYHQRRIYNKRNRPFQSHGSSADKDDVPFSKRSPNMDDDDSLSDRIL